MALSKLIIVAILFLLHYQAQAQSTAIRYYALTVSEKNPPDTSGEALSKLNPEINSMFVYDPFLNSSWDWTWIYYPRGIDAVHELFFCVVQPSGEPVTLYNLSLTNGEMIQHAPLPESLTYLVGYPQSTKFEYDTKSNRLFGISYAIPLGSGPSHLVTISPETGETDELIELPYAIYDIVHQGFDASQNTLYLTSQSNYGWTNIVADYKIIAVDLNTNSYTSVDVNTDAYDFSYSELAYNCIDGFLYGVDAISHYPLRGECRMTRLDPLTGDKIYISDVQNSGISWPTAALDPFSSKFYFREDRSTGSFSTIFDIVTHDFDRSLMTESFGFNEIEMYMPVHAHAAFSASDFCENALTSFSAYDTAVAWQWDFGDGASGLQNTSNLKQPQHKYSSAGEYTVTLIASTCYDADTLSKIITIEDFPDINLGEDFILCANAVNDPVILSVDAPAGVDYTWSDFSHAETLTINEPGTYWVKVSGACGNVYDTLSAIPGDCDCNIAVYPNLTHSVCNAALECSLDNYPNLNFYVFNMLGEKMYQYAVNEISFQVDVHSWPYAPYIYIFESGGKIIKRGKIEVVE